MPDETEVAEFSDDALADAPTSETDAEPKEPEADPIVDPSVNANDPSEAKKLLADQFGDDPEKLAKSYLNLREKLDEQGGELGQIRQLLEQQAAVADVEPTNYIEPNEDTIEENPGVAAEAAWQAGDAKGVKAALDVWQDVDRGNPFQAAVWYMEKRSSQREETLVGNLQEALAPVQQKTQQDALNDAYSSVSSKHPEFDTFMRSTDYDEVLSSLPGELKNATVEVLRGGDQDAISSTLEHLYLTGVARSGATPPATVPSNQDGNAEKPPGRQAAAVMGSELGAPTGGATEGSEMEKLHDQIRDQVGAESTEDSYVTAARQLRADRNLKY